MIDSLTRVFTHIKIATLPIITKNEPRILVRYKLSLNR